MIEARWRKEISQNTHIPLDDDEIDEDMYGIAKPVDTEASEEVFSIKLTSRNYLRWWEREETVYQLDHQL